MPSSMTLQAQRLGPWLLVFAALMLLFRDTVVAMVTIWDRSDTFAHAFLVPPIVLWLVWRRRAWLAPLPARPQPWLLALMALVCAGWLLGELASANALTQFTLVALVVVSVPAVLGWAIARALTFPLLFLFFCVPIGEFMQPQLMEWTADFTVLALQMTGIPVLRDGLQFVIPSGTWSVVEACSGVRYMIASFMVGTLFAYLNYRSARRRVLFMVVSLLVPVVANWLRAYMIVMIGHLSGNTLAAGVDHIIYGWVFFGIVVMLMFMIGARWSEPEATAPATAGAANVGTGPAADAQAGQRWLMAALVVAVLAGTQGLLWRLNNAPAAPVSGLQLPDTLPGGWVATEAVAAGWTPGFGNPSATTVRSYRQGDRVFGVWVGYYRQQGYDRKLVSSTNGLVSATDEVWAQVGGGGTRSGVGAEGLTMRSLELRASPLPDAGAARYRVWQNYWLNGRFEASATRVRLGVAIDKMLGRGDDGAVILLYTPLNAAAGSPAGTPESADAVLDAAARAALPELTRVFEAQRAAR